MTPHPHRHHKGNRDKTARKTTENRVADVASSDVPLEDRRLGQPGQPLPHAPGSQLAHALDGLQVVDAGGQQLLEGAEVVDESFDDAGGSRGTLVSSR